MDDFDGAIDGVASIGIGVYLVMVFFHGNIIELFKELKQETGFLEFLIAALILYKLLSFQMTKPIIGLLIIGAILVVLIKAVDGGGKTDLFTKYGRGTITMFELATGLFA